jgi:aspartyl protease family protein
MWQERAMSAPLFPLRFPIVAAALVALPIPSDARVVSPLVATPDGGRVIEVMRASDGLFYLPATINGHEIRLLVDTGANVVMLTRADAEKIGLEVPKSAFRARVHTVNGTGMMIWTKIRGIRIADQDLPDVDAAILEDGLPVSLLGQNLLSKLGTLSIDGDRLEIHLRGGARPE